MSSFDSLIRETVAVIASFVARETWFCWNGCHELARLARCSNRFGWLIVESRLCMQAHCRRLIEVNQFAAEDFLALQRRRITNAAEHIPFQLDQFVNHGQPVQFNAWDTWSDDTDHSILGTPLSPGANPQGWGSDFDSGDGDGLTPDS